MSNSNNGGKAFPSKNGRIYGRTILEDGMSLRDYFAGQALQGLLAGQGWAENFEIYAKDAYSAADAMLLARNSRST